MSTRRSGTRVDGNITHDNEDSGIENYPGADNTLIYNNVSYNNGDHGIDDVTVSGARILSNTIYNNVTAGINLEGNSSNATIANNISVDNGIGSPRTHSDIRVEHDSTAGTTMDYNQVYLTRSDTLLIWNSVNYNTLAAFQAATGQMLNGINADPKWADLGARDFHLHRRFSRDRLGQFGHQRPTRLGCRRCRPGRRSGHDELWRRPADVRRSRRVRVSAFGRLATIGCIGGEPVLGCVPVAGVGGCFWFFG